jgi:peptidyl-prolyl cis-trans isomerase A (cyclophilin A)
VLEVLGVLGVQGARLWFTLREAVVLLAIAAAMAAAGQRTGTGVRVVLATEAGEIEIEVDAARAPRTAANFLRYVDAGFYDGGRFHRTVRLDNQPNNDVRIEVIQAAASQARRPEFPAAIALERTSVTGLSHTDGTVSMARAGPDTGRDEFFICIGDQRSLDYGGARNPDGQGFAAFGRVVRGMDVVRKIQGSPARAQRLTPPIGIVKATRRAPPSER